MDTAEVRFVLLQLHNGTLELGDLLRDLLEGVQALVDILILLVLGLLVQLLNDIVNSGDLLLPVAKLAVILKLRGACGLGRLGELAVQVSVPPAQMVQAHVRSATRGGGRVQGTTIVLHGALAAMAAAIAKSTQLHLLLKAAGLEPLLKALEHRKHVVRPVGVTFVDLEHTQQVLQKCLTFLAVFRIGHTGHGAQVRPDKTNQAKLLEPRLIILRHSSSEGAQLRNAAESTTVPTLSMALLGVGILLLGLLILSNGFTLALLGIGLSINRLDGLTLFSLIEAGLAGLSGGLDIHHRRRSASRDLIDQGVDKIGTKLLAHVLQICLLLDIGSGQ
mmetsp:Transcript_14727/g.34445  ORF Transcript_14727/g.34445 Transcript_14727/m.34445 type:complete len:333 (-) Transcript_14727:73-1071(-)